MIEVPGRRLPGSRRQYCHDRVTIVLLGGLSELIAFNVHQLFATAAKAVSRFAVSQFGLKAELGRKLCCLCIL